MQWINCYHIINFRHKLYLSQVLSAVQQTTVSWTLSVRKVVPRCNSLLQKCQKGMLYCLAFMPAAPISRFHNVGYHPRTMQKIQKNLDESNGNYEAQNLPNVMIDNNFPKSVGYIPRNIGMSKFLNRQVVHEYIYYSSCMMTKRQFFHQP